MNNLLICVVLIIVLIVVLIFTNDNVNESFEGGNSPRGWEWQDGQIVCDCEVPQGPPGVMGPQGDQGVQGEQGIQGVQGEQGEQGEQGKSAFEVAFDYESEKPDAATWAQESDEDEQLSGWLDSLVGQPGPPGPVTGVAGDPGPPGPPGPPGEDGENGSDSSLPSGVIVAFKGRGEIPNGWVLCNGDNNTPDLRGRFILCAGTVTGNNTRNTDPNRTNAYTDFVEYGINDKGGYEKHQLTIDEMPSHTHGSDGRTGKTNVKHRHSFDVTTSSAGNHSHSGTTANSGRHRHSIRRDSYGNDNGHSLTTTINNDESHHPDLTGEAGNHNHTFSTNNTGAHTHDISGRTDWTTNDGVHNMDFPQNHDHSIPPAGGDGSHNNMPPFYALRYIMKT